MEVQSKKTCQSITDHSEVNTSKTNKKIKSEYQKYKKVFKKLNTK